MTQREAGRELDADVAEMVMGERVVWREHNTNERHRLWIVNENWHDQGGRKYYNIAPCYSTDMGDAWYVVERMSALGWWARIQSPFTRGEPSSAGFTPLGTSGWNGRPDHFVRSPSVPLAICLAALAALENSDEPHASHPDSSPVPAPAAVADPSLVVSVLSGNTP